MLTVRNAFLVCAFSALNAVFAPVVSAQTLSVALEPVENGVAFLLTNEGADAATVLTWETPLEAEITQDLFEVISSTSGKPNPYGSKVRYSGRLMKRGVPQPHDYRTIGPGETLRTIVPIASYYDLGTDGNHSIRFRGEFHLAGTPEPIGGTRSALSSNAGPQVVQMQSQSVSVQLSPAPKAEFARAGGYNSCSANQQSDLVADLDASEQITLEAAEALRSLSVDQRASSPRYLQWFGAYTAARFNTVLNTYDTAADRMADESVEFNCNCSENIFAYVFPIDPYKVYVCNLYWAANRTGTDSRAGTILHELSHFPQIGDTDDFAYGASAVANLARTNPTNAIHNADSIEYFAENTPFRAIASDADAPAPQLDEYTELTIGVPVTGAVPESQSDYYQVTGVDRVELTSISGDADLYIYSTAARDDQLCRSTSTGANDACDLSGIATAYVEVFGFRQAQYSLLATSDVTATPLVAERLVVGESLAGSVVLNEEVLFDVSGADAVSITSLSGDVDLYVFSDADRRDLVCVSNSFSDESLIDTCELSGNDSYIVVYGFESSNFEITTSARNLVAPPESATPVGPIVTPETGVGTETFADNGGSGGGSSGSGPVGFGFMIALVALTAIRRSAFIGLGAR